jgi:hypothetical protein
VGRVVLEHVDLRKGVEVSLRLKAECDTVWDGTWGSEG